LATFGDVSTGPFITGLSAGRLPVVFERLDGEVNWVVTEMGIEGRSGEYSS
jgi:hypothetical protein